jgi:hypothetical protein
VYKLGLLTTNVRSAAFMGSDRCDQAVWLLLIAFCADQENGGRIVGCRKWKPHAWLPTVGVSFDEVDHECDLWLWDGDDLIAHGYSIETEEKTRTLRERGRIAGQKSGEARKQPSSTDGLSAAQLSPERNRTVQTDGQPNGQPSGSSSSAAPSRGGGTDDSRADDDLPTLCDFPAMSSAGRPMKDWLFFEEVERVQAQFPSLNVLTIALDYINEIKAGKVGRPMSDCIEGVIEKLCRCEMAEAS